MSSLATVRLWGRAIGAVSLLDDDRVAAFEYEPEFATTGIELSPLQMPASAGRVYRFPGLSQESFSGLPGLLADSLPDRYGNALIDAWLASRNRTPGSFNAVERLSYIGRRGMGALEFVPSLGPNPSTDHEVDVAALVDLAGEVLARRADLAESLARPGRQKAMREILRVGTSAGGARPKALIAWNPTTGEARSGQLDARSGFEHWILKFDGVEDSSRDPGSSKGYGAIEQVHAEMAKQAGIEMMDSRLLEEGGRRHFMTKRFDRDPGGERLHMQSLAAVAHLDFGLPGANSYEQAFQVIRQLRLPPEAAEQQFRRMVFNVVARNQDDHVKNIAFLMNRAGEWSLSPAFDMVFAYNAGGNWTALHQMSINGKRDNFTLDDLRQVADLASMKRGSAERILTEVTAAVQQWPDLATEARIEPDRIDSIGAAQRLRLPRS